MNLPRIATYCALAAMPMALATSASALVIDDFSGSQVVASQTTGGLTATNQEDGSMLGGERDMAVINGTGLLGTVGLVDSGTLNFSNSPTSQGTLSLDYDGNDDSDTILFGGLGAVDLTDGGASDAFAFTLLFADFEVKYTITAVDTNGDGGVFTGTLPTGISGGGDEVQIVTSFASFASPLVDFADIGTLLLTFEAQEPAADIVIDNFRTDVVPEPSSVALLLAGGALIARRRRRA